MNGMCRLKWPNRVVHHCQHGLGRRGTCRDGSNGHKRTVELLLCPAEALNITVSIRNRYSAQGRAHVPGKTNASAHHRPQHFPPDVKPTRVLLVHDSVRPAWHCLLFWCGLAGELEEGGAPSMRADGRADGGGQGGSRERWSGSITSAVTTLKMFVGRCAFIVLVSRNHDPTARSWSRISS